MSHEQHNGRPRGRPHPDSPQPQPRWNNDGTLRKDFIEQISNTELDSETKDVLSEYLTKDLVHANLNSAEHNEFRWLSRIDVMRIWADFPPQGSVLQQRHRAALLDDPTDKRAALTPPQRSEIKRIVRLVHARATRGKEGWQQEQYGKTHQVRERIDRTDETEEPGRGLVER